VLIWDDLRFMLAVRRHGSLGRAAKALALNKSTISRRVAALEAELGVSLMQRNQQGYELTAAGEAVTQAAERMDQIANELIASVGDADRVAKGVVSVTVPAWFAQHVIIPALGDFREMHPGLDVHLMTTDDVVDLSRREVDIALRNARPTQQSLIVRKAGPIAFAMYAARDYITRLGMPTCREDLERHQLIGYRDAVAYVAAYRWTNELSHRVSFRAADATSMLEAVSTGLGIGVLPCFLTTGMTNVVCVDTIGPPEPETIWLVTHPDTVGVERVRVVDDWLVDRFVQKADFLVPTKK